MSKVLITGLGFITSIGNDSKSVLSNLQNLQHGIELYKPFNIKKSPVKLLGTIKEFNTESTDPEDWSYPEKYRVRRETLRSLPAHGLYAMASVRQAFEDAKLSEDEISNPYTGLFTASGGSAKMTHFHLNRMHKYGPSRCSPLGIVSSIAGTLNFNLVAAFRIQGASCGFVTACASSAHALGYAYNEIALGRQNRMIVIGAEDGDLSSILPFASMRALSTEKNPLRASCPFDKARNGFVGTGGATTLILENENIAKSRNSKIYAEFKGWGQSSDGHNVAISHPKGAGLKRAIQSALAFTKTSVESIDYINAHATSTLIGDLSEIYALKSVFTSQKNKPAISSTKALTGHGLSLSSAMEAGFSVLSMYNKFFPGSAHIETLDPEAKDLNIIQESQTVKKPKAIMSNSSGFGGANVSLIFTPYIYNS